MILERGEDATREWLEALAANDPVEFDGNAPIVDATDTGEPGGGGQPLLLAAFAGGGSGREHREPLHPGRGRRLVGDAGRSRGHGRQPTIPKLPSSSSISCSQRRRRPSSPRHSEFLIDGVPQPDGVPLLSEIAAPDIDLSELAGVLDLATRLVAEAGLVR